MNSIKVIDYLVITLKLVSVIVLIIPVVTILLAALTWLQQKIRCQVNVNSTTRTSTRKRAGKSTSKSLDLTTAIFCGRVSHTRYQPVKHSFSYPLFFCLLDLAEVKDLFISASDTHFSIPLMWPLNYLINFRHEDHLKNGEGQVNGDGDGECGTEKSDLNARVRNLVKERTLGKYVPSIDQQILLLTHLSYYGYCFNPVSFYYILKKGASSIGSAGSTANADTGASSNFSDENIEAIVAEVSNTPWNEMKCYVLHPDSEDMMQVKDGRSRKLSAEIDWNDGDAGADVDNGADDNIPRERNTDKDTDKERECCDWKSINYIFKKKFHVSPFMDMDHIYDWTFWHLKGERVTVSATMKKVQTNAKMVENDRKQSQSQSAPSTIKYFNAFFDIRRASFDPLRLCYQLLRFPVYCFIIQIWIHVEAFKLFFKGVEFIPHPEGAETAASKFIASAMAPFFAFQDWLANRGRGNDAGTDITDDGHDGRHRYKAKKE